jgi:hypothetical protein
MHSRLQLHLTLESLTMALCIPSPSASTSRERRNKHCVAPFLPFSTSFTFLRGISQCSNAKSDVSGILTLESDDWED